MLKLDLKEDPTRFFNGSHFFCRVWNFFQLQLCFIIPFSLIKTAFSCAQKNGGKAPPRMWRFCRHCGPRGRQVTPRSALSENAGWHSMAKFLEILLCLGWKSDQHVNGVFMHKKYYVYILLFDMYICISYFDDTCILCGFRWNIDMLLTSNQIYIIIYIYLSDHILSDLRYVMKSYQILIRSLSYIYIHTQVFKHTCPY